MEVCFHRINGVSYAFLSNMNSLSSERFIRCSGSQMFFKIGALKNFVIFTGKKSVLESFFNRVAGFRSATLLKRRLLHKCFPVNIVKFLKNSFFVDLSWLLLICIKMIQHMKLLFFWNIGVRVKIFSTVTKIGLAGNLYITSTDIAFSSIYRGLMFLQQY